MTTTFHLVRHAPHADLGHRLSGRASGGLTAEGRREAEALGTSLRALAPGALLTSPRLRAAETAAVLATATGLFAQVAPELDEIDFGRWTGQRFDELEADPEWRAWNRSRDDARTPAGDAMGDVADRLTALIDRLRAGPRGRPVALVTHGDVIKAGVCRYLGLPFGHAHRFEISPASITTLAVGDWGGAVLALNRRGGPAPTDAAA